MNARGLLLSASAALALCGCAQTAYRITESPSSSTVRSQTLDTRQCNEDSRINILATVLFCGVGALICREVTDSRYEGCMRDKGYQIKPIG